MKVQKIVSLTPETAVLAKKMKGTFSYWVRSMLWMKENGIDHVRTLQRYNALLRAVNNLEDKELAQSIISEYHQLLEQTSLEDFQ